MTSKSVSHQLISGQRCLQTVNDNIGICEHEQEKMLHSAENSVVDRKSVHDLNTSVSSYDGVGLNQVIELCPSLTSNIDPDNASLSSVRRPLSPDEPDDGFRIMINKKKQKQIARDDLDKVNDDNISYNIPATTNTMDLVSNNDRTQFVINNQHRSSQNDVITNESARFAQTRYPFPPFILRFNSGKVTANQVKKNLIDHIKKNHQTDVQVINCRLSLHNQSNNEYDVLIYVKDAVSFSFLLDETHWPKIIGNEEYSFPSTPAIPPQLCLLIKNVDLRIDFEEFCTDIRANYPQVKNIIRMKNKFQNDIKLIKLELTSSSTRDDLLNQKRIIINYITYEIIEYLAPANVLICSKCMALGHFKKQCTQIKETCRTCGEQVDDMKIHKCSKIEKCIHCEQNHKSSSLKCPVVKSFRSELTRKILHGNNHTSQDQHLMNKNFTFNSNNFPPPPPPQGTMLSNNTMMVKIDELINKLSDVKNHLANLEAKHDKFEQFITEKSRNDTTMSKNMNDMCNQYTILKKEVVQQNLFIERHENLFCKLLIPMLEDIFLFISSQNQDKKGNALDADLKCRINRYLVQTKKATEGKQFSN
ncbi:unnamed protein product [Rotaria magnacalcarata]|uniref:CCHC-type domain-containing protein n=1 Tax=Rotaria magnacalcarata TaxID=392030 RepID=A0A816H2I0_9BILA|nr:unnamed protein product [Rotaria magnacalcarata]CAF1681833.1 unnamed protein product [Rotaria magnacalcarata]CAF4021477.1 unnamed protein product [Rotaria magnacalcarata]CAF4072049.1 unnamed protein product [Rotaria magnacalcarata]